MDSMLSRLTSNELPKLKELSVRNRDDASIAMLDACATMADVLSFYQERIANEGYLRTASQRRSIMELANLPGYTLRPGVSASVYLAYTLDDHLEDEAIIPQGSAVQSIPGPDELPQTFETSEEITARTQWNNLQPRMSQPQTDVSSRVYLQGVSTQLKTNDAILIQQGSATPDFRRIFKVVEDADADRTLIQFAQDTLTIQNHLVNTSNMVDALTQARSVQPRNSLQLARKIGDEFSPGSQSGYTALKSFAPQLKRVLADAAANAKISFNGNIKVYALRRKASVFGHNTAKRTVILDNGEVILRTGDGNWPVFELVRDVGGNIVNSVELAVSVLGGQFYESPNIINLDAEYDGILPGSWVVVETQSGSLTAENTMVVQAQSVKIGQTRSQYGMTGTVTRIHLGDGNDWLSFNENDGENDGSLKSPNLRLDFDAIRSTKIYAEAELLELAEEPIDDPICSRQQGERQNDLRIGQQEEQQNGHQLDVGIELDGFYDGLESGRWVIVYGERDIPGTSRVMASELAMLANVEHKAREDLPGDSLHTTIRFAKPLVYCFKRDSLKIYGNVVKATHGETLEEILGNGDTRQAFQTFELKQAPLTFTAASNPSGVDTSLVLRVNNVRWHQSDCLVELSSTDHKFVTKTDDEDKTKVIFGNGINGALLPTGTANIRARYRSGIGQAGNVHPEQITLLKSQPLGIKEVINPLRASGGANREHESQARHNIPLGVKALDRLVSVQDYEDFSRVYAGIGKAKATEISDGHRQLVHLTIAGSDDIPIDKTSDLYRNLRTALHDFGDPYQAVELAIRERLMMVLQAGVKIHPDYEWETVSTKLRETLLERFSFADRELGQDVYLSEIFCSMGAVSGVVYVDVDAFGGVPEKEEFRVMDTEMDRFSFQRRFLTPETINQRVQQLLFGNAAGSETDSRLRNISIPIRRPQPRQKLRVNLAERSEHGTQIRPAQIAFFDPQVPATLILNEIR